MRHRHRRRQIANARISRTVRMCRSTAPDGRLRPGKAVLAPAHESSSAPASDRVQGIGCLAGDEWSVSSPMPAFGRAGQDPRQFPLAPGGAAPRRDFDPIPAVRAPDPVRLASDFGPGENCCGTLRQIRSDFRRWLATLNHASTRFRWGPCGARHRIWPPSCRHIALRLAARVEHVFIGT